MTKVVKLTLGISLCVVIVGLVYLQLFRPKRDVNIQTTQRPYGTEYDYINSAPPKSNPVDTNTKNQNPNRGTNIVIPTSSIFGFIRGINTVDDTDAVTLKFDEAEWAPDIETADLWSKEDQGCFSKNSTQKSENCNVPSGFIQNGFYIRNKDKSTIDYGLTLDVQIKLIQSTEQNPDLDVTANHSLKDLKEKLILYEGGIPAWIKLDGNLIVYIEEQYLP